ncbi:penicillin acylase family protein [Streptomyces sp. NPDC005907]|uniref:penicillin acylase family protein n=1 Tax=Streptomyces sp. NPDC005907 TaxID=3154571 RepID=UPI0033CEC5A8
MSSEIYRDALGIPHLRADGARELAHLQGRVTAADRAWQLEVERHRAQGTSAAFLGPDSVGWDCFVRRARVADTARHCFTALEEQDPETADWIRAYVDGVNAGLPRGADRAPEFAAARLEPGRWEPWTPLGVWLSTHILFVGFPAKLWREEVVRRLGADAVGLFATDGPGTVGSNGWLLTGERTVTGRPVIAGDPHRFIEDPGVYQQIRLACPEFDVVGLAVPGVPGIAHFAHTGTVAWAITNAMADYQDLYRERLRRTPSGVEALDPDGVWRPASCHVETVEVAGGEPVEVEVVETRRGPVVIGGPRDPGTGTDPGTGETVTGVASDADRSPGAQEVVAAGQSPGAQGVVAAGKFVGAEGSPGAREFVGAEGPPGAREFAGAEEPPGAEEFVGAEGVAGFADAISLRYPPRVTHDLGFGALLPLLRARRVADVDRALDRWAEPVNVVQAADTEGGLLHRVAGKVPVRGADNRTRVVPAWEPGHEWRGWHEMPRGTVDDGLAVMANQRGPASPLGTEFAAPHRARRIRALLTARKGWSAPDMAAVHTDTHLASAAPLLERLAALDEDTLSPRAAAVWARLLSWDRHMDADSTGAAAYAAVRGAVVRRLAAHPALACLTDPPAYPEVFRPWLSLTVRIGYALENLLTARELPGIDRAAIVQEALEETAAGTAGTPGTGTDVGAGTGTEVEVGTGTEVEVGAGTEVGAGPGTATRDTTWGDTHRLAAWRALPTGPNDEPALSGDHDCVLCTSAVPGVTDLAARGPAARYVWDLAHREDSLWVVPLGASGVPGTPHHRDQLPLWLRGDLAPVVTDWDRLTKENDDH